MHLVFAKTVGLVLTVHSEHALKSALPMDTAITALAFANLVSLACFAIFLLAHPHVLETANVFPLDHNCHAFVMKATLASIAL